MRELEERYGPELVVVGVHSGKFIAERDTANIRDALARLDVAHPVVNDRQFRTWRAYAVQAWPTLVLVDPEGRVVAEHAGEVEAEALVPVLDDVIGRARDRGTLVTTPLPIPAPEPPEAGGALRFPAKVLADPAGGRLCIADTGHHRILVVRLDGGGGAGEVEASIGAGVAGFRDGAFGEVAFDHPHGIALAGERLYVADTRNHAIRLIDLGAERVETVAGTGELGMGLATGGPAREVPLRSPWDVLPVGDAVYIAMAGSHQIWRYDPRTEEITPWAGSGAEELHDDVRAMAALAQPSGLTTDGRRLYFADSESSAVRFAGLEWDGRVGTIVGTGLFDFGDRDGIGDEVRLQHPQGIAWHDGVLYLADTYNGKVKRVDPDRRAAETWLGNGGELREPGGIAIAGGRVYIADTNHHRIAVASLGSDRIDTLEIRGA